MSHSNYRPLFTSPIFKILLLSLALFGASLLVRSAESYGDGSGDTGLAPHTSASRIYVDPNTGALSGAPVDAVGSALRLTPELRNSVSRSTAGLVIEDGAGGGKMVRLQGRFRHLSAATANGDSVKCFDGSGVLDVTEGTVK